MLIKLWSHKCTEGLPYQCCLLYLAIGSIFIELEARVERFTLCANQLSLAMSTGQRGSNKTLVFVCENLRMLGVNVIINSNAWENLRTLAMK